MRAAQQAEQKHQPEAALPRGGDANDSGNSGGTAAARLARPGDRLAVRPPGLYRSGTTHGINSSG